MYTANQAREDVKKYEARIKEQTLEKLLEKEENANALQIFETKIFSLASEGNTKLVFTHREQELFKLFKKTDIKLILKYLGYSIKVEEEYGSLKEFTISW